MVQSAALGAPSARVVTRNSDDADADTDESPINKAPPALPNTVAAAAAPPTRRRRDVVGLDDAARIDGSVDIDEDSGIDDSSWIVTITPHTELLAQTEIRSRTGLLKYQQTTAFDLCSTSSGAS